MGRTIEPYSRQIERIEERLKDFRKGLRKKDQEAFDELMRISKLQIQAGVMASSPNPFDSMMLSILISMMNEIKDLKSQTEKLNNECIRNTV